MKDTLRILVSWKCNLKCAYCCNEQPQFRKDIIETEFDLIPWKQYNVFCVTGGEPLLNMPTVEKVCRKVPKDKLIVLYTNGVLMTRAKAMDLQYWGVKAINVGLHHPSMFTSVINTVDNATFGMGLSVRFHAQDCYTAELRKTFPNLNFRFWTMNDCDRGNEDRIVLKETP